MEICCSVEVDDYAVDLAVVRERTDSILEFTVARAGRPVAAFHSPVQLTVHHGDTPVDTEPILTSVRPGTLSPLRFRLATRFPAGCRMRLTFAVDGRTLSAELSVPVMHRQRIGGWRRSSCLTAHGA